MEKGLSSLLRRDNQFTCVCEDNFMVLILVAATALGRQVVPVAHTPAQSVCTRLHIGWADSVSVVAR